jgi:hypothetical protein
MQTTNSPPIKVSDMVSKAIDKFMLLFGAVAFIWILIFLLVAMIEK